MSSLTIENLFKPGNILVSTKRMPQYGIFLSDIIYVISSDTSTCMVYVRQNLPAGYRNINIYITPDILECFEVVAHKISQHTAINRPLNPSAPESTIDPNYSKPKETKTYIDLDFEDYECWQPGFYVNYKGVLK